MKEMYLAKGKVADNLVSMFQSQKLQRKKKNYCILCMKIKIGLTDIVLIPDQIMQFYQMSFGVLCQTNKVFASVHFSKARFFQEPFLTDDLENSPDPKTLYTDKDLI